MTSSGTTIFSPSVADLADEALARIGILSPSVSTIHLIEARRSANIILQSWSSVEGQPILFAVDLQLFPLIPGVAQYQLPSDTIQILDVYVKTFQPNSTYTTIGNTLTPALTAGGVPMVTTNGDPMVLLPGSGTFSTIQGSQTITLTWPSHPLASGLPIFLTGIVSVGGLPLSGFFIVSSVIDANTVQFTSPLPALYTQSLQGAPPLFQTTAGSSSVFVIYPHHGLATGSTFTVPVSTTVGGLTLSGSYTVTGVTNSYQFSISAATSAGASTAVFQNNGQFQVTGQQPGQMVSDIILGAISRTDYASISDKFSTGRPTTFWLDRLNPPSMYVWPVSPANQNSYYGVAYYRMRQIQDALLTNGQTPDFPNRAIEAFVSSLATSLSLKFKPEMYTLHKAIADEAMHKFLTEEAEHVPLFITPDCSGYFR